MQPGSFDQIYQDYFDSVYRYALSLSGNPQTAEEIAQETFFKAMRTLDQFQGKSSLKSWLCAIAKNLWLSEQRIRKNQPMMTRYRFKTRPSGRKKRLCVRMKACASIDCSITWTSPIGRYSHSEL